MIYKIFIPQKLNDGEPVNKEWVVSEIFHLSDGFTVYDGEGYFRTKDKVFIEPVWVFEIASDRLLSQEIEVLLLYFKSALCQESVFYINQDGTGILV